MSLPTLLIPSSLRNRIEPGNPPHLLLTGADWFTHYLVGLLCVIGTALLLYFGYIQNETPLDILWIAAAGLITVFVFHRRARKLHFVPIASLHSQEDTVIRVLEAATAAGWSVAERVDNISLSFWTSPSQDGTMNYGELVTFLFGEGAVFVNSINDPGNRMHLYSGDKNKGIVNWIEVVVEKGVWKYDPDRPVEERRAEYAPKASIVLHSIREGKPPIQRANGGYLGEWLVGTFIAALEVMAHVAELAADTLPTFPAELLLIISFGIPMLLVLVMWSTHYYYSRYSSVSSSHQEKENYRLVSAVLQKQSWHINYADPDIGIEARVPNSTPEEGIIAAFVFQGKNVFVNLFKNVQTPVPLRDRSERKAIVAWVEDAVSGEALAPNYEVEPPPIDDALKDQSTLKDRGPVQDFSE